MLVCGRLLPRSERAIKYPTASRQRVRASTGLLKGKYFAIAAVDVTRVAPKHERSSGRNCEEIRLHSHIHNLCTYSVRRLEVAHWRHTRAVPRQATSGRPICSVWPPVGLVDETYIQRQSDRLQLDVRARVVVPRRWLLED